VSVVLNGAKGNIQVSESTRRRIVRAARELNYRVNPAAQALRRQGSATLGLLMPVSNVVAYTQGIQHQLSYHVRVAAARGGFDLVELAENENITAGHNPVRLLSNTALAGLMLMADRHSASEVRGLIRAGVPVVQLLRQQPSLDCPAVLVDPRPGMIAAIAHLREFGHEHVAFIGGAGEHPTDRGRVEAFREGMAVHGLRVRRGYVRLGDSSIHSGMTALRDLLGLSSAPTAVVVGSDIQALGVLRAAYERSWRIPDALSVVSYDDVFADFVAPALTSITQPLDGVADAAVELLRRSGEAGVRRAAMASVVITRPTTLTVRQSTGPVPMS